MQNFGHKTSASCKPCGANGTWTKNHGDYGLCEDSIKIYYFDSKSRSFLGQLRI